MNQRKHIRKKVAELLRGLSIDGQPVFDPENVFSNRVTNINTDELPAATVFIERGEIEEEHSDDLHTVDLFIHLYAHSVLNVDDELDDLDELVNALLEKHPDLDGLVDSIGLSRYEFSQDDKDHIGLLELQYTVKFQY